MGAAKGDAMATIDHVAGMDVEQDMTFQRRQLTAQRVGWALGCLVLLAALAGVFGEGPLSSATASDQSMPFSVQYRRFARHGAPAALQVHLQAGAIQKDSVRIWLNSDYLAGINIETIFPEPASVEAGPDRMTYVFELEEPGQSATFTFNIMQEATGMLPVRVGLEDGEPLRFRQFVYP